MTSPGTFNQNTQSSLDIMKQTLESWGLGSLYNAAAGYLTQGTSADEVTLLLQQTPEYKARFAGNATRQANGLSILNPAQYIATEEQYRNIMQQYGLPPGFYDSHDDFTKFIGQDIAPTELQQRAQIASQQFIQAPQEMKDYWAKFGLTAGQAVASILDPNHSSLADLQTQANAVQIGGTAAQQGIDVTGARSTQLAQNGVTLAQAQGAYQRIAQYGQTLHQIGNRFGTDVTTGDQENALLLNNGDAARKIDLVNSEEAAQFAGHGGADTNTTSTGNNY